MFSAEIFKLFGACSRIALYLHIISITVTANTLLVLDEEQHFDLKMLISQLAKYIYTVTENSQNPNQLI